MAPATAATTSSATAATCDLSLEAFYNAVPKDLLQEITSCRAVATPCGSSLKAEAEVTQEHAATTFANINPDAFWLDLSMVIMLTDGYGSYPGRALAQVCQSARHHCGGNLTGSPCLISCGIPSP